MDPLVFALVGAAAMLHVSWNVLAEAGTSRKAALRLGAAVVVLGDAAVLALGA